MLQHPIPRSDLPVMLPLQAGLNLSSEQTQQILCARLRLIEELKIAQNERIAAYGSMDIAAGVCQQIPDSHLAW